MNENEMTREKLQCVDCGNEFEAPIIRKEITDEELVESGVLDLWFWMCPDCLRIAELPTPEDLWEDLCEQEERSWSEEDDL